jgi:hypothetical protein
MIVTPVLDRRIPSDWKHVQRHRFAAPLAMLPLVVEKILNVPRQYRDAYNQGMEGACVGFSQSWMMSILNRKRYDARRLYNEAQLVDEWDNTPPEEGTSLRAGFDVLRKVGHWRFYDDETRPVELDEGIEANRWATSVDDIRAVIASDSPVNLGINWYQDFSDPIDWPREGRGSPRREYYIGTKMYWGQVLGGHAITCVGASDKRQAFALCNTWGTSYPFIVWMPYDAVTRLLKEEGEAGVIVDRP